MFSLTVSLSLVIISFVASSSIVLYFLFSLLPITLKDGQLVRTSKSNHLRTIPQIQHAYLWLTLVDLAASAALIWEAFEQHYNDVTGEHIAIDTGAASRLWVASILRHVCLICIGTTSLLCARRGKPTNFGFSGWKIWAPLLLFGIISTVFAGVFAHLHIKSFFPASTTFICTLTLLNTSIVFAQMAMPRSDESHTSPNAGKPLNSDSSPTQFAPEDVDALRNRDSWVTSVPNTTRTSMSSFSFDSSDMLSRNGEGPISEVAVTAQHDRSFIAEPVHHPMLRSAWSLSTTMLASTNRTPKTNGQGTLSAIPAHIRSEIAVQNCCAPTSGDPNIVEKAQLQSQSNFIDPSFRRNSQLWIVFLWVVTGLSLPYLVSSGSQNTEIPYILSVTLHAPVLLLSLFVAPLPISEVEGEPVHQPRSQTTSSAKPPDARWSSSSVTVVGDRRSSDVWLSKGEAVDGKGRLGRAASMLARHPKLVVLPPKDLERADLSSTEPIVEEKERGDTSAATGMSSYVAVEKERERDYEEGEGDISQPSTNFNTIENVAKAHASVLSLPSTMPTTLEPALPSMTSLRRSSGSTRGSKASRLLRNFLKTDLDPIPDSSVASRPRSQSESSFHRLMKTSKRNVSEGSGYLDGAGQSSIVWTTQPQPMRSVSNASRDSTKPSLAIDSLSAKVLPILVPRITIGPDTEVEQTPQRRTRTQASQLRRPFSSPELLTSTPPNPERMVRLVGKGKGPQTHSGGLSTSRSASSSTEHTTDDRTCEQERGLSGSRSVSASSRRSKKRGTPPSSFKMLPPPDLPEPAHIVSRMADADMPVVNETLEVPDQTKLISRGRSQRYLGIPSRFRPPPPVPRKNPNRPVSGSPTSPLVQMGLAITSDEPDPFRRGSIQNTDRAAIAHKQAMEEARLAAREHGLTVQEATELLADSVRTRGTSSSGTMSSGSASRLKGMLSRKISRGSSSRSTSL